MRGATFPSSSAHSSMAKACTLRAETLNLFSMFATDEYAPGHWFGQIIENGLSSMSDIRMR